MLQLSANKPVVKWDVDSYMLNISNDGKLSFKPVDDDIGNYGIKVSATSADGENATQSFLLKVTSPRGEAPFAHNINLVGKVNHSISYDIGALVGPGMVYSGVFDQFTINSTSGKFNFTPNKTGVFVYQYYVINKQTTRVNHGEISIIVS